MEQRRLRIQLETLKATLSRNEEEHGHLVAAVKSFEGLLKVYDAETVEALDVTLESTLESTLEPTFEPTLEPN